jgi:hypothetical protein
MHAANSTKTQTLAAEFVKRHAGVDAPRATWDIPGRWRRRRFERRLVDAPLRQLREAVASAQQAG